MSSTTPDFLKKKAREISYALNKVSFYIKRAELKNRIERLSFEFLENTAVFSEDNEDKISSAKVLKNISALDILIRIGHSLYEIETVNSNILLKELDSFRSAIATDFATGLATEPLHLESIFSAPPAIINEVAIAKAPAIAATSAIIEKEKEIVAKAYDESIFNKPIIKKIVSENKIVEKSGNVKVRQDLILEKIRQMNKVSVKDIVNMFPGVSERTLRYDLQNMCERGVIKKEESDNQAAVYSITIKV